MDSISGFTTNELITHAVATKGWTSTDLATQSTIRDQLMQGLNLIQFDYCGRNDWNFLHTNSTLSVTASDATYDLANDCEKIEILYDKANNRIIRPTSNKEMTRADPNEDWTNSGAYVYTRWGDRSIILQPTPTASGTLYYRYKKLPAYISSLSAYPTVPFKYQKTLLHGLKSYFYDLVDDQRADRERQLFEQGIGQDWEKDVFDLDDANRFLSYDEWSQNPVTSTYEDFLSVYFG